MGITQIYQVFSRPRARSTARSQCVQYGETCHGLSDTSPSATAGRFSSTATTSWPAARAGWRQSAARHTIEHAGRRVNGVEHSRTRCPPRARWFERTPRHIRTPTPTRACGVTVQVAASRPNHERVLAGRAREIANGRRRRLSKAAGSGRCTPGPGFARDDERAHDLGSASHRTARLRRRATAPSAAHAPQPRRNHRGAEYGATLPRRRGRALDDRDDAPERCALVPIVNVEPMRPKTNSHLVAITQGRSSGVGEASPRSGACARTAAARRSTSAVFGAAARHTRLCCQVRHTADAGAASLRAAGMRA